MDRFSRVMTPTFLGSSSLFLSAKTYTIYNNVSIEQSVKEEIERMRSNASLKDLGHRRLLLLIDCSRDQRGRM